MSAPTATAHGTDSAWPRPQDERAPREIPEGDDALDEDDGRPDRILDAVVGPQEVEPDELAHRAGREVVDRVGEARHRDERDDPRPVGRRHRGDSPSAPPRAAGRGCSGRWPARAGRARSGPGSRPLPRPATANARNSSRATETGTQTTGLRRRRVIGGLAGSWPANEQDGVVRLLLRCASRAAWPVGRTRARTGS